MLALQHTLHQSRFALVALFLCAIFRTQGQITWNPVMDIAPSHDGNQRPRIVTDRSGNPLVIWGKSGNVMFSRWAGEAFTTPVQLNPDSIPIAQADWMGPDIAAHGDTIYVVFKQTPEDAADSHVWCIHSFDDGMTFSPPMRVEDVPNGKSRFPAVTTDNQGNPVVAFMKFNDAFGAARWVVTRSTDFGNSFSADVLASRWSSPGADVCDCCPGTVTCEGQAVAMLYRDNNNNIRDTWAGISQDTGATFSGGMNVDQQNWMLQACPSSGPDGVIVGDTLYAVCMNGASGMSRTYFSASAIPEIAGAPGILLTDDIPGLNQQNYPRIAHWGKTVAIVWKQYVSGSGQVPFIFAEDITGGLPAVSAMVGAGNIDNPDIAIADGNIFVVWQDNGSGTVKLRSGTYVITATQDQYTRPSIAIFPNPTSDTWTVKGDFRHGHLDISLMDVDGSVLYRITLDESSPVTSKIDARELSSGIYFIRVTDGRTEQIYKAIKY